MYFIYITSVSVKIIWMYHSIQWADIYTSNSGMTGSLTLNSGGTINNNSRKMSLNTNSIVCDWERAMKLLTGFEDMNLEDW